MREDTIFPFFLLLKPKIYIITNKLIKLTLFINFKIVYMAKRNLATWTRYFNVILCYLNVV